MPKDRAKLDPAVIDDFVAWIKLGAPMPADSARGAALSWEALYEQRLNWWSLQPLRRPALPAPKNAAWARTDVDRFVLAALETEGLTPRPKPIGAPDPASQLQLDRLAAEARGDRAVPERSIAGGL